MTAIITLSTDINVITAEINAYKQTAGHAIFEIGRRLKHVKETDLAHGQWERWCREDVGIDPSTARRFIIVNERLADGNRSTWHDIGWRVLYEIASFPAEERDQPHTIPSTGAVKTVDEMTVRELREVKAELKREREAREKAEGDYEAVRDTLESITSEPPRTEVRTEYVRDPTVEDRLRRYEERFGDIGTYESASFRIPNATDVSASVQTFSYEVRSLLKKYAYLTQYRRELTTIPAAVREDYAGTLDALAGFVSELRDDFDSAKRGAKIINVN